MPVIEVRVTSARDYRAGWPTRVVLSEERNAGVLSSSPQREHSAARRVNDLPLTITPLQCIRIREGDRASIVVGVPG